MIAGCSHLLQVVQPVHMSVGGQVNAQVAAIQGACACAQPQQGLDVLGLQRCCFQHVCQACLHNSNTSWQAALPALLSSVSYSAAVSNEAHTGKCWTPPLWVGASQATTFLQQQLVVGTHKQLVAKAMVRSYKRSKQWCTQGNP